MLSDIITINAHVRVQKTTLYKICLLVTEYNKATITVGQRRPVQKYTRVSHTGLRSSILAREFSSWPETCVTFLKEFWPQEKHSQRTLSPNVITLHFLK